MSILEQAVESSDPRSRANAIEALKHADKQSLSDAVRAGLVDENRGVRFVAVMMMGEAELCDNKVLLEPLLDDPSPSVQAAVLCTLYKCGQQVDLNPIGIMLNSDDPEQRGNAALVLGEMGNTSAVSLIRHASRTTPSSIPTIRRRVINLQMAEALVKLGEEQYLVHYKKPRLRRSHARLLVASMMFKSSQHLKASQHRPIVILTRFDSLRHLQLHKLIRKKYQQISCSVSHQVNFHCLELKVQRPLELKGIK